MLTGTGTTIAVLTTTTADADPLFPAAALLSPARVVGTAAVGDAVCEILSVLLFQRRLAGSETYHSDG